MDAIKETSDNPAFARHIVYKHVYATIAKIRFLVQVHVSGCRRLDPVCHVHVLCLQIAHGSFAEYDLIDHWSV